MASTEAEFKRRLQLNAEGLPLLKSASSTIKHADVAKGKGQLLQSSEKEVETLHRKRFFDADKKFKELLQTPISKLMPDLKRDNVKASISALQTLSSILSDNEDLHAEISLFLDENKVPGTLAAKVGGVLSEKHVDDLSWSYLSEIFNVVKILVNDADNEAFIKSMIDEDFTELTIQFLRHPTVLNQYQKDPVLTRTVVSALGVLVPMFLYSPSIDAQELNDTYGEYLQSSNDDVRMLAQKSAFALSMILLRSVVEQQEGGDGINLQNHSGLSQNLLLLSKRENFTSLLLSGNNEEEWKELSSSVLSLNVFSRNNMEFIDDICKKGVIGTICSILNNTEIIANAEKFQRVNFVIVNLLLVLLHMTMSADGKRQLLHHDAYTTASKLLNSKVNSQVQSLAIALASILSDKLKSGQSLPGVDTKPEIVEAIVDLAFPPEVFTVELESKISNFLLGSGFSTKLCIELYNMVNIDGRIRVPEPNDSNFELFCKYIGAFATMSINSKEWLDRMVKASIDDVLKSVLCSETLFKRQKTNKDTKQLIRNVMLISNAFAFYGFEEKIFDKAVFDRLYSVASSQAQDTHAELLRLLSKSYFVLMSESKPERMPTFIDKRDLLGSIRFIDFFMQTYGRRQGLTRLNNCVCKKGVLDFVASTVLSMINANQASLLRLIIETKQKFVLLYKLAECAGSNVCFSQELSQSGYMKLVQRLLSDGDIRQTYTSEDITQQKIHTMFLDVNMKILLVLLKTEENVALLAKPNVVPEMIFFASGTMVSREDSETVGHVWKILAKVWLAYGSKWPNSCRISPRRLTDCIICPDTLQIIITVMLDDSIEEKVKTAVLDMVDKAALAVNMCKAIGPLASKIKMHLDDEVDEHLILLLDCLYVFGLISPCFSKSVGKLPEYTVLIDKVLGGNTDPLVIEVDEVGFEYCKRCLRLILLTVKYNVNDNIAIDQRHFDLINKWVKCPASFIQMLALSAISLLPFEQQKQNGIDQMTTIVCTNDLMLILKKYVFTSTSARVDIQSVDIDMPLRIMFLLAHDKYRSVELLSWFNRPIIGDLIENIVDNKCISQWQRDALKYAVSLVWLLTINRLNIKRLLEDPALVSALKRVVYGDFGAVGNAAFCCLLEITGEAPEHKFTLKEKYDAAVIGPEALETLSSGIDESLKADGYRVVQATFSQAGHRIIDTIHSSQFVIYLFNQETEYSAMCHTAVSHAHRTDTPFIGVYVGDKAGWGNWPISPQNKVYMANTGHDQVLEMLRTIRQRIPRVNLCLNPHLPADDIFMTDFNKFVAECRVGDKFISGNFVGSVFDSNGGYLMLPSQEVVLYVPPGAIADGKRQPVYCHGNEYMYGGINAGKVALSPIVHCGPDGADFKRDVVLTFPHCAVNPNNWKFTALTRAKEGSWNKIPEDSTIVKDEFVYVFLDHFTGFTTEGEAKEGKTAQRRITIGARGYFSRGTSCQVQVGAWCATGSLSDDRKISGISASWGHRTALCVGDQDTYLMTEVQDVEEGWQQRGSCKTKIIRLADVGTDKDPDVTNCQFTFRHNLSDKEKPDDFFCTVSVTSEGQENTKLELLISNTETQTSSSENDPNWAEMTNAELYRKLNKDWNPKDNRVGEDLWRSLCEVLDAPRGGIKDWKGFAEKLELEAAQINTLQLKESPTSRLLAFFFTMELIRGNKLDMSLRRLMAIFGEMENDAAKTCVRNYVEKERMRDP